MLEAILKGAARAEAEFPMAVGILGLLQRIKSVEDNAKWCDWILEQKHFVGLDLADDEVNHPSSLLPLFEAKSSLGITVLRGRAQRAWRGKQHLDCHR